MLNLFTFAALLACLCLCIVKSSADNKGEKTITGIDQRQVCRIKHSCVECLRLTHCSWCQKEEKCFSNELEPKKCDETNEYTDYGFSLHDNAKCSCNQNITSRCLPEGADEKTPPCSGRGACVCGRCVCQTYNSTKMVMGDFCEFDNFSCDGPDCNEGPYSLMQAEDKEEPQ